MGNDCIVAHPKQTVSVNNRVLLKEHLPRCIFSRKCLHRYFINFAGKFAFMIFAKNPCSVPFMRSTLVSG
jgi:hypothetical protein